ncbi:baseplate multidomain protein megatron [Pelagibacterium luteolum]|uniref:Putative phage tail protein n=1 Tax=Pelagibacterium luteolum TaxID=440168 RepID=A0A1G7TMX7_9HYPH|nr:glycoside hydrolase TIM-barrel-like domain-containing protein [Pelagibacterium luteolum]SDG36687.1 Putative phage tail protein [Pelagibacterium luteolum]
MATLALTLAGQMVGGAVAGPIGATIGRALGALAGSAIDGAIFGERPVAQGSDVRLTGSSEGGAIPRVYGWCRVAGNVIWATELERITPENSGSKGFGRQAEEEAIAASFAVALCEGEVAHMGRIWADGRVLETEGLSLRFYRGTRTQNADGLIAAKQGEAPAYRGLCYIVFERLDLTPFGNRIPNISVEVCRPVGDLERDIRAMCVIPGSTEFGYDPAPRVRVVGRGETEAENTHASGLRSNWDVSIDELLALCPNLKHVGLVVSWFGTDLRCGECVVEPRVEAAGRQVEGTEWAVAGLTRGAANVVSEHAGGPAYGGTPSDASVIAAIRDLRARGISVTLYPFVMMDVPVGNGLIDPFTLGAGQPAHPWRGRITCHPAPGVAGSPDGTAGAGAQVAAFITNGYREMILHYAALAEEAGGVEAFLIGSEMRHLTWVRSGATQFPFVDALKALAADVRGIVGGGTKITYAADWSEYSGLQPEGAPGDKIFHLDPLWADENIDAVGIDNYMPMADWRDGQGHLDAQKARSIYELEYLKGNIAGGEGFDWFYASVADRAAQARTPISDGAHGEDWVWRYKDLVNWWSQPHHNRVGGVRSGTTTDWVPRSKPVWLTEFGCGAVDKGPNGPNAFGDPKSSEDKRPAFSTGRPDALVQRQALRACHQYWRATGAHNPTSPVYGGRMLDTDRIYIWCWDARPYPAFPGLADVWADAANYSTGHWLNGRLGAAGLGEMLAAIADEYGVATGRIDAVPPMVTGLGVEAVASLRDVAANLAEAGGLAVRDRLGKIEWISPEVGAVLGLEADDLERGDGPVTSRRRGDPAETAGRLTLNHFDRDIDYRTSAVLAVSPVGARNVGAESGLVLEADAARFAARAMLMRQATASDALDFALPPSALALEPGDLVTLEGEEPFRIEAVRDGFERRVSTLAHGDAATIAVSPTERRWSVVRPPIAAQPLVVIAHLPDGAGGSELVAAAYAQPWPGPITLRDAASGVTLGTISARGTVGVLTARLEAGPLGVWARGETMEIELSSGHVASGEPMTVLASANRIAVQSDGGGWELVGFETAELVAPRRYRLSGLLRGLRGTVPGAAASGQAVMVINAACLRMALGQGELSGTRDVRVFAGPADVEGRTEAVAMGSEPVLPLAPVHLTARRDETGALALSWIRRSRVGGNDWSFGEVPLDIAPERYRVCVFDGDARVRQVDVGESGWSYSTAAQEADFGGVPAGFGWTVQQVSPVLGPGLAAHGEV